MAVTLVATTSQVYLRHVIRAQAGDAADHKGVASVGDGDPGDGVEGERVLSKRQVDDFEIATLSERIANILLDKIEDLLTFPLKRM